MNQTAKGRFTLSLIFTLPLFIISIVADCIILFVGYKGIPYEKIYGMFVLYTLISLVIGAIFTLLSYLASKKSYNGDMIATLLIFVRCIALLIISIAVAKTNSSWTTDASGVTHNDAIGAVIFFSLLFFAAQAFGCFFLKYKLPAVPDDRPIRAVPEVTHYPSEPYRGTENIERHMPDKYCPAFSKKEMEDFERHVEEQ